MNSLHLFNAPTPIMEEGESCMARFFVLLLEIISLSVWLAP